MRQALARKRGKRILICLHVRFSICCFWALFPFRFSFREQPPKTLYTPKYFQKLIFSIKTLEIGKCLQLRQNTLVLNTRPIVLLKFRWIFNLKGLSPRHWPLSCDAAFPYSALWGGGGRKKTWEVRVSCLPYFCAPLPPDSHPSLCCSRLQVNREDQKPGLTFKKIALKREPLRTLRRAHWSGIPLKQVCTMRENLQ